MIPERDKSSNAPRAFHVRERYLHNEAGYLSRAVNLFAAVLIVPRCVATSSNEFVYILYTSFNKFLFYLHTMLWNLPLYSSLILYESTEFMIYIFSSVHEFYSFVPRSFKRQHTRKHILRPRAQNFFSSKCQLEYEIKRKFKYKRLIRLHGQRGFPLVDHAVHSGTNKMS